MSHDLFWVVVLLLFFGGGGYAYKGYRTSGSWNPLVLILVILLIAGAFGGRGAGWY